SSLRPALYPEAIYRAAGDRKRYNRNENEDLIRRHGTPRHSACRSSGVNVSRGATPAREVSAFPTLPIEPVWSDERLSVMIWYSLRAPSWARCPMTGGAWPPTSHAAGWRSQN